MVRGGQALGQGRRENGPNVCAVTIRLVIHVDEFDVFRSQRADKPLVEPIARVSGERGLNPWLDIWSLPPGRCRREIERGRLTTRAVAELPPARAPSMEEMRSTPPACS